jgi:predicted transcriptional regulator YdeE
MNLTAFRLAGLALPSKTTNANGQSGTDCGTLWQQFEQGNYAEKITGKLSEEILAVYHGYEGDHTRPFSYFIGCKVSEDATIPAGMDSLVIPGGTYRQFLAKGKMPGCIADAWGKIWNANINRAYQYDFETYDERSKDWSDAEVDLFISVTGR